ncbi:MULTISPECIES: heptaprenyl diphosphate synthase component 1 [Listeria]|uniref:heptaprenyl diphosphate synthase component 1 n=1 Tax=Listeria TaxID=1637 RepID=UPI000B59526D|nr:MULTISPECIES: heptaprenyl diphosphate synthase component 1 [Listeria]
MTYQGSLAQLKEVERLVHEKSAYRFLKDNFYGPETDKDQMLWLNESIHGSDLAETEKYRIITATLYVILAHDTHEMIDEDKDGRGVSRKGRELTVLAGDYYSALYYRTMAELGMTQLLAALQRGVQKTNTAKTNIYQLHVVTDDDYMEELLASSSAIFAEFSSYFKNEEAFTKLACQAILLKRLEREQHFYEQYGLSTLKRAYDHGFFVKEAMATFEEWLEQLMDEVKMRIHHLLKTSRPLSDSLHARLNEMLQR